MQHKIFGPNATCVPVLGFGCGRIGSFNNPSSERETTKLLERALELGVSLFDTADIYGQGDSERAIGRLLKGRRDAGFVVTKVGNLFSRKMRLAAPFKPFIKPILSHTALGRSGMTKIRQQSMQTDFSPAHIRTALEASLKRLRMDYVDVLLLHGPSAAQIDDPHTVETLQSLKTAGRVGAYGVACEDEDDLVSALKMPGISVLEVPPALLLPLKNHLSFSSRRVGVLLREVIRNRGTLSATEAVASHVSRNDVTCVVVGTTSCIHLEELANNLQAHFRSGLRRDHHTALNVRF